jgi:hypothetical protein
MTAELADYEVKDRQVATVNTAANMALVLKEEGKIREMLKEYIEKHMVEGEDYGKIPGTDNPTLLQPGAEKTLKLFRLVARPELTEKIQSWDPATPLFHYAYRTELVSMDTDKVVGVGIGSCNSMEDRYRWRKAARKCPKCSKEAIIKGSDQYGGGWVCWKKKDGCGAKFDDGDKTIESQEAGRILNDNVFTQVNSIEKMSFKRSLVSACVPILRGYGFMFTQDMEDMGGEEPAPKQEPKKDPPKKDPPKQEEDPYQHFKEISPEAVGEIGKLFDTLNYKWEDPKIRERVQKAIGRPIGLQERLTALKESEGETLIRKLKLLVQQNAGSA